MLSTKTPRNSWQTEASSYSIKMFCLSFLATEGVVGVSVVLLHCTWRVGWLGIYISVPGVLKALWSSQGICQWITPKPLGPSIMLFLKSRSERNRFRLVCYLSREVVGAFQKHLQDKCSGGCRGPQYFNQQLGERGRCNNWITVLGQTELIYNIMIASGPIFFLKQKTRPDHSSFGSCLFFLTDVIEQMWIFWMPYKLI